MKKAKRYCRRCGREIDGSGNTVVATVREFWPVTKTTRWGKDYQATKSKSLMPQMSFCIGCGAGAVKALEAYAKGAVLNEED